MSSISVWPGYVDALSALLMVVIFMVLIFTIAQFLLSEILSGKESELVTLQQRVTELARLLGLEEQQNQALKTEMSRLSVMLDDLSQEKESLNAQQVTLSRQSEADRRESVTC